MESLVVKAARPGAGRWPSTERYHRRATGCRSQTTHDTGSAGRRSVTVLAAPSMSKTAFAINIAGM